MANQQRQYQKYGQYVVAKSTKEQLTDALNNNDLKAMKNLFGQDSFCPSSYDLLREWLDELFEKSSSEIIEYIFYSAAPDHKFRYDILKKALKSDHLSAIDFLNNDHDAVKALVENHRLPKKLLLEWFEIILDRGSLDAAKIIVNKAAKNELLKYEFLQIAVKKGNFTAMKDLYESDFFYRNDSRILMQAICAGHIDIVEFFFEEHDIKDSDSAKKLFDTALSELVKNPDLEDSNNYDNHVRMAAYLVWQGESIYALENKIGSNQNAYTSYFKNQIEEKGSLFRALLASYDWPPKNFFDFLQFALRNIQSKEWLYDIFSALTEKYGQEYLNQQLEAGLEDSSNWINAFYTQKFLDKYADEQFPLSILKLSKNKNQEFVDGPCFISLNGGNYNIYHTGLKLMIFRNIDHSINSKIFLFDELEPSLIDEVTRKHRTYVAEAKAKNEDVRNVIFLSDHFIKETIRTRTGSTLLYINYDLQNRHILVSCNTKQQILPICDLDSEANDYLLALARAAKHPLAADLEKRGQAPKRSERPIVVGTPVPRPS